MDAERARLERARLERARHDRGYPRLRIEKRRGSGLGQTIAAAILIIGFLGAAGTAAAISTNTLGAGDLYERLVAKIERFIAGPPPDRPTVPTVTVTPKPSRPAPSVDPIASDGPATPTPSPIPRVPVDVDILPDPGSVFAHQLDKDWCAPAGVTMVLAATGNGAPTDARQREIASRVREWESRADSRNGLWGPAAMVLALADYGATGYEIRAYDTRAEALHGAAVAISTTRSPAVLLAWRGAHTWVMSGYRANADPVVFDDAKVSGAYILDPWYPWTSNIWGKSDPPGAFQDAAEMNRNFLPWKRPEGKYPDRDGKFIVLIPTIPLG